MPSDLVQTKPPAVLCWKALTAGHETIVVRDPVLHDILVRHHLSFICLKYFARRIMSDVLCQQDQHGAVVNTHLVTMATHSFTTATRSLSRTSLLVCPYVTQPHSQPSGRSVCHTASFPTLLALFPGLSDLFYTTYSSSFLSLTLIIRCSSQEGLQLSSPTSNSW